MPAIQALIDHQLRRWEMERARRAEGPAGETIRPPLKPVITVSRQHGSGGSVIAGMIARRFDYTLLHRDVIERISSTSGTRRRIIEALDAGAKSQLAMWCESMVSQRYMDTGDYVRYLHETINSVAALGGAVVVGRGANFIIGMDRGVHVRVVAPLAMRIERLAAFAHLTRREAARDVVAKDRDRETFVRKTYGRDIDDPLAYDLIVNTASMTLEEAAALIENAAHEKFERLRGHAAHVETFAK